VAGEGAFVDVARVGVAGAAVETGGAGRDADAVGVARRMTVVDLRGVGEVVGREAACNVEAVDLEGELVEGEVVGAAVLLAIGTTAPAAGTGPRLPASAATPRVVESATPTVPNASQ
jgi:hypothetical protein